MTTKVILLGALLVVGQRVFNPPQSQSPLPHERRKYGKEDQGDWLMDHRWVFVVFEAVLAIPAACEVALLLSRDYPAGPVSEFVLSLLANGDRTCALRMGIGCTFLAGWTAAVAGGLLRIHCYRVLGRQFTTHRAIVDGHQLVTTGPYAIVRHPSYAAFEIYMAGMIVALFVAPGSWVAECGILGSWTGRSMIGAWMLCAMQFMVTALHRCAGEDEVLRKEFGDKWVRYSQRTTARLLPGIY